MFTCSGCECEFYVFAARVQRDGSLRCWECAEKRDGIDWPVDYDWCCQCRKAKRWGEFRSFSGVKAAGHRCSECRAAKPVAQPRPAVACRHCGVEFTPTRSDARYCSGRCRVAAHREARKAL